MTRKDRSPLENEQQSERLGLRLYIVDGARNSDLALYRAQMICDAHFPGSYDLEVIDLTQSPERLLADGILVTPTLLRFRPAPVIRIIGALEDTAAVLQALRSWSEH